MEKVERSKAEEEELVFRATVHMLFLTVGASVVIYGLVKWILSLIG